MIQSYNFVTIYLTQEGALGMDVWCALMLLYATFKCQRHRQILLFELFGMHLNINILLLLGSHLCDQHRICTINQMES